MEEIFISVPKSSNLEICVISEVRDQSIWNILKPTTLPTGVRGIINMVRSKSIYLVQWKPLNVITDNVIVIIRLMLSVCHCSKVITLNGFLCNQHFNFILVVVNYPPNQKYQETTEQRSIYPVKTLTLYKCVD